MLDEKLKTVLIVIPVYNGRDFISKTIESCINQTYDNVLITVVDDGSTDGTREILSKYKDEVLIVENKKNLGLPASINSGFYSQNSDYLIYLGHDDILPDTHVENMLRGFSDGTVAVHCNSRVIDENDIVMEFIRDDTKQHERSQHALISLCKNNFISVVGMMVSSSEFRKIGGWDEMYDLYGEWLLYSRLLKRGSLSYSTESYAYYRRHSSNISSTLYSKERVFSYILYRLKARLSALSGSGYSIRGIVNFLSGSSRDFLSLTKRFFKSIGQG